MKQILHYLLAASFLLGSSAFAAELKGPKIENLADKVKILNNRVTNLENTVVTEPYFGGYGVSFAADGATKNVVLLSEVHDDGRTSYWVRSRYETSTEEISIDSVLVQRPYIANYAYAETNDLGELTYISNYIEAPDTLNYVNYNVEESEYDPVSINKTVTADTLRENWVCGGNVVSICTVTVTLNNGGAFQSAYGWSSGRALAGPITVNGMVFNDVRLEAGIAGRSDTRIRAKGIGEISRTSNNSVRQIIYYYANGASGGSLAGTPFESGQPLYGLFF
jgi:hypothetical protein